MSELYELCFDDVAEAEDHPGVPRIDVHKRDFISTKLTKKLKQYVAGWYACTL